MKSEAGSVIVALQYMRGLAALLVVWDHSLVTLGSRAGRTVNAEFAWHLGELGVAIFFAISGAVMVMGHYDDFGRPQSTRTFITKRLIRIMPLYWITTALVVARLSVQKPIDLPDVALSLLLVPHASVDRMFGRPIYELGWTLQYELFFYALFALALVFKRRLGLGGLLAAMLALVVAGSSVQDADGAIPYLTQPIILYFVAGAVLGWIRASMISDGWRVPSTRTRGAMLVATLLLAAETVAWHWVSAWSREAMLPVCVVAVAATCTMTAASVPVGRVARGAVLLGDITYALYLTHLFVLGPATGRIVAVLWPTMPTPAFVLVMLALTLPVAYATYRWVERPLLALARRYVRTRATPAVVAANS